MVDRCSTCTDAATEHDERRPYSSHDSLHGPSNETHPLQPREIERAKRAFPFHVEAMHLDQLRTHGSMPGLRDDEALERAFARPQTERAYTRRIDQAAFAAAFASGLARNHPFNDGNTRIAFHTAVVFPTLNGWDFEVQDAEVVAHVTVLADGRLSEAKCAAWMRAGMRRLPSGAA